MRKTKTPLSKQSIAIKLIQVALSPVSANPSPLALVVSELEPPEVLAATKLVVVWPENSLVWPKPSVELSVMVVVAVMALEPLTPAGSA